MIHQVVDAFLREFVDLWIVDNFKNIIPCRFLSESIQQNPVRPIVAAGEISYEVGQEGRNPLIEVGEDAVDVSLL